MAGVDPVSLAITGLTTMSSLQQGRAQAKAQTAANNARRQQILEQRRIEERREGERLKHALAARRARFAASGVSSGGGSAAAVLSSLRSSSADDMADRRRLGDLALSTPGGGRNLFGDRLGLAANLLRNAQPHLPRVSLFDAAPRRRPGIRTPSATI